MALEALVSAEDDAAALQARLGEHFAEQALTFDVQPVTGEGWQALQARTEMPRLIVSLMGPRLPATMLAELGELAAAHG